ncbi:hypothetical protein CXF83_14965 [Shewanella sp. Choline-02u-19]|uniref:hypothetical protein n=1 Tax=unclassified Shewanella TaxID=196818 RepID=UPI000C323C10|nr:MULTISPECIES: hypothetical protein [unclassified Shewanella]PKH62570.1 hypothetical protein CXF84_00965 [Shewanella sp. Bg11-22]PKI27919.1 hypothetical protein CXF83_14965 [Shewanella sp. Choline-02u-19]
MALSTTGFDAVTKELKRMRAAQAPAIENAINDAAEFGSKLAVDEIFNRYGFKSRSYIESLISVSIHPKNLTAVISARYRPSTLTRFATPHYRAGKGGTKVVAGYSISALRNQPVWFKGAFTVIGRNGNQLMFLRSKGDNSWRKLNGQKSKYGPSVAGSFGVIRDVIEPPIITYLRERYGRYAK